MTRKIYTYRKGHIMKINEQTSYKGYLITCTVSGYTISKGGYHIAWAKDLKEAKSSVDLIVDLMD